MKKAFIFLLIMIFVLAGCSSKETNSKKNLANENIEESETITEVAETAVEESENIDVDSNLSNVEITLPASMFESEDIDDVIAEAKEEGINEVIKNNDGSITYKISKSHYKEMMTEIRVEISTSIEEMISSGDYVSIKDILYNDSFSEYIIVVNKGEFENSFDSFITLALGMQGMYYQMFDGVDEDDAKVTVIIKDADTDETINTIIYPDSLNLEE